MAVPFNLDTIELQLPNINGEFAAGIASATEQSLRAEEKLEVVRHNIANTPPEMDANDVIKFTLLHNLARFRTANASDPELDMYLPAILISLKAGLLTARDGDIPTADPDGDWVDVDKSTITWTTFTQQDADEVLARCTVANMTKAATVILATKMNWWKENHHTGQGTADSGHFTKKALEACYGQEVRNALLGAAHRIGHWASTRKVLQIIGIQGITNTFYLMVPTTTIRVTDDIRLRSNAPPAGTARANIAYELCCVAKKYRNRNK